MPKKNKPQSDDYVKRFLKEQIDFTAKLRTLPIEELLAELGRRLSEIENRMDILEARDQ